MKVILLFLAFAVAFSSCQQTGPEFSCDPIIDNFVKKNQQELSTLTLDEFLSYGLPMQKAIYNSWDATKKRDVWIEKLERVAEGGTLNAKEVEYIQQLIEHIHSDYFTPENLESEKETRTQFARQWISDVKSNLGWTDKFIAFVAFRLYTDETQLENELSELQQLKESALTNPENCNCNQDADFCDNSICESGECNVMPGCGWLWSMDCNGICNF